MIPPTPDYDDDARTRMARRPATQIRKGEACHCGHLRRWHDASANVNGGCYKCDCMLPYKKVGGAA